VRVHVVYVGPDTELVVAVDVADGSTVDDALRMADVGRRTGAVQDAGLAIFGQRVDRSTPLREGDRVEITRPLLCDPKAARRARAAARGATNGRLRGRRARRSDG